MRKSGAAEKLGIHMERYCGIKMKKFVGTSVTEKMVKLWWHIAMETHVQYRETTSNK